MKVPKNYNPNINYNKVSYMIKLMEQAIIFKFFIKIYENLL